jgi:hypothetical protein
MIMVYGFSSKVGRNEMSAQSNFSLYVTPEQFGAKGDKVTDDTLALQKAIDSLGARGGMLFLLNKYVVDSNDLIIKPNVTIFGREGIIGNPGKSNFSENDQYQARGGQIILNPKYKIIMSGSSAIKGVMLWRKGLVIPEPNEAKFDGTCIEVKGEDCYIGYSLILGFTQAVMSRNQGRLRVEFVQGDCTNGIWIDTSYDISTILNCHFWPFITVSTKGGFGRNGVAYKFTGASDMTKVVNCFSYDHKIGFQAEHAAGMVFSFCNADGAPLIDNDPPTTTMEGSIGYDIKGYARGIRLIGCEAWGKRIGFQFGPQNTFGIGGENNLPITMEACKTELVVDGVKSNCDLMMNGCDIRGIGIKSKKHYGTGLEIAKGSSAQITGSRFIDWDVAIKKPTSGDVMVNGTRFIGCNNEQVDY